jgi:hypothetical protein
VNGSVAGNSPAMTRRRRAREERGRGAREERGRGAGEDLGGDGPIGGSRPSATVVQER